MRTLIFMLAGALAPTVQAAPQEPVWALAQKEKPAAIETLRELVNIESGSRDKEGLDRLAARLGERLEALGAKVEFYEPGAADTYRLFDTPKEIGKVVVGRFQGSGARRIMLLAHMDTVYPRGKAAHAGVNPELGRNAIVELAHQILQTSELSDAESRIKFNWTLASGGQTRNVIPELATASADVRVNRVADFDVIEKRFRERVKKQRVADAQVEAGFERRRAPLVATDASRALARRAQAVYAELGLKLPVDESGNGGGTDAAFAAASGKPAVAESFGFAGFGYHSSEEEYVELDSIEPRLYLMTRLIMDASR